MTRVRDIMHDEVITVTPDASVREIAQTLVRESIGGVPVVDGDGRVLGVVSASDIVRTAARDPEVELDFGAVPGAVDTDPEDDEPTAGFYAPEEILEWIQPVLQGDRLDEIDAAGIMTPATFFVRPDLPISEFAEFLIRGRIHRALVLEEGQLVGIATSFDALRALAEAGTQSGVA